VPHDEGKEAEPQGKKSSPGECANTTAVASGPDRPRPWATLPPRRESRSTRRGALPVVQCYDAAEETMVDGEEVLPGFRCTVREILI